MRRRDGETARRPVQVGLVGCGYISDRYLKNAQHFPEFTVVACADATPERATRRAEEYGVPAVSTVAELLADPAIEIVLNLTTPEAHASIARAALEAGKGVYNEKPLATALEDGKRLVEMARSRGLRLGAAPDTFLGGGLQTCRQVIDEGGIGQPVAATAFMLIHGHERWHPDPDFYYQRGGGPLFDMGPYYLTALISLLGPVRRVTGSARATFSERTIRSEPRAGERIAVEVPTHLAAVLDFANGPIATLVTSFDVWASEMPKLEIYGSEGSLSLPDPNTFGGPVRIRGADDDAWRNVPVTRPFTENSRGLGLADMATGLRSGAPHRANGDLAFHVLEVMHAVETASREGRHVEIISACERPEPL
ncbi:MAG: Gfo/Idh/MocA family oxidoreductase [Chloroflexi bacterium]|nr:Gfo/Idh/MocA family oxidoreductase [Chloroflexota bacterium]